MEMIIIESPLGGCHEPGTMRRRRLSAQSGHCPSHRQEAGLGIWCNLVTNPSHANFLHRRFMEHCLSQRVLMRLIGCKVTAARAVRVKWSFLSHGLEYDAEERLVTPDACLVLQ